MNYKLTQKKEEPEPRYMSYESAQQIMKEQEITTLARFLIWNNSGQRPSNFPAMPSTIYQEKWQGWDKFLSNR